MAGVETVGGPVDVGFVDGGFATKLADKPRRYFTGPQA